MNFIFLCGSLKFDLSHLKLAVTANTKPNWTQMMIQTLLTHTELLPKQHQGFVDTYRQCPGMSLALDRWPVATWFGLWATYFWILLARTGHLHSKPNLLKIIINQFFCKNTQ